MRARSLMILEVVWGLIQKELLEKEGVEKGEKNIGWPNNATRLKIRVHGVKSVKRLIAVVEAGPRERED